MSVILPDKQPLDIAQLNGEVQLIGLPGFTGLARLSRDLSDGSTVAPYLFVKVDALTAAQQLAVTTVVQNHVPIPPMPTRQDSLRDKLGDNSLTFDELKEMLRRERGL